MWRLFLGLLLLPLNAIASSHNDVAVVNGDRYLGVLGATIDIEFNGLICLLYSAGNPEQQKLSLVFTCNGQEQVLWHDGLTILELDEPRFELLWAGDNDGDGKLDLILEVSPKYSCSQQVQYRSSIAPKGLLVGQSDLNEVECG
ncbi:hypothetical protein [Vibrio parahaemolyticus]|uniref:hypothetical protein n=2 Tax=Vibrio parahaemolyticus TaxID=670 RepID=UPI0011222DF3|nr:hypothetical protein [Vibrio parahaemolyticus]MCR9858858.1 hypothetical protein [Vibrio parahaemolyticus]TOM93639.1 hypothetical protein CGH66_24920 [Vibrio parahaemolyticus]TOM98037.1 hypothetical protein CGH67_25395 [Vibrio parahaemolyticus]TON11120.1 hypothetical protein CGH64_23250 [Vibrio parahaemolyticus]TON29216.1 hypothetical protein CGH59_24160 [Vibrio parahaemolyticus]